MLSAPPAKYTSPSPALMARLASMMLCSPLAQSRFTVVPGTVTGRPASNAAMRAVLRLSSPAWLAAPIITSSMAFLSTDGLRRINSRNTKAAKSSGRTLLSAPPNFPIGVRTASHDISN